MQLPAVNLWHFGIYISIDLAAYQVNPHLSRGEVAGPEFQLFALPSSRSEVEELQVHFRRIQHQLNTASGRRALQ